MSRRYLPVALSLVLFGLPLVIGLGRSDMDNDEAIYSYSVERMLALHDWMTPRAIYDGADDPFLEKPPLKIWIVAAGQLAGLPRDESGLRFFDPLFGVLGFAYVFALGRRLAGPLCGFVALFVLFTFQPLVFEHGLRSNNMESAMLLTYCGGVYHFFRWTEEEDLRRRRLHAWAVAAYFAFGFLAKFVAAAFLPIVMAAVLLWRRDAAAKIRAAAAEWVWPAVAALAAIAPWFVYQSALRGRAFWNEILGHQVLTRFTSFLDPNHLRPWHYYFVELWKGLAQSGDAVLAVIGLVSLVIHAWRGRPLARILLIWWIVPFALISSGTSKLIHYMYPFIPPIALGAGAAAAAWMDFWNAKSRPWQPRWALQYVPAALSLALLLIALWTAEAGPLTWKIGSVRVLRTTTAIRPFVLGVLALCAAGSIRMAIRVVAVVALAAVLPIPAYATELRQLGDTHRPLHAIRDCVSGELRGVAGRGVAGPGWMIAGHSFFYYFRSLGPNRTTEDGDELRARLFTPADATPVIVDKRSIARLQAGHASLPWESLGAVDLGTFVVVLPGPYESCTALAVASGAGRFQFPQAPR